MSEAPTDPSTDRRSARHAEQAPSPGAEPRTRAELRALREKERLADPHGFQERVEARRHKRQRKTQAKQDFIDGELKDADGQYISRRTLMQRRREARERIGPTYVLRELAVVIALALFLSFALKTWFVQPFFIPSGSMQNTLQVGDRVLVSKLSPHPQTLQRGDIVVFNDPDHWLNDTTVEKRTKTENNIFHDALVFVGLAPNDSNNHLIKRVIGLPGDHVKCCTREGLVTVNDVPITEPYIMAGNAPSVDPFDIHVPQGKVWVMGDHRSNSSDSRFHNGGLGGDGSKGSVPIDDIVGRAVAIAWPADRIRWLTRPTDTYDAVIKRSGTGAP